MNWRRRASTDQLEIRTIDLETAVVREVLISQAAVGTLIRITSEEQFLGHLSHPEDPASEPDIGNPVRIYCEGIIMVRFRWKRVGRDDWRIVRGKLRRRDSLEDPPNFLSEVPTSRSYDPAYHPEEVLSTYESPARNLDHVASEKAPDTPKDSRLVFPHRENPTKTNDRRGRSSDCHHRTRV